MLGYLRVIHNPDDDMSLRRIINVPPRGIGDKTLEQLVEWALSLGLTASEALLHLARLAEEQGNVRGLPFSARTGKLLLDLGQLLAQFIQAKERNTLLPQLLMLVLDKTNYLQFLRDGTEEGEDRANNVRELFSVTDGYQHLALSTALPAFLEEVALVSDVDELDAESDAATLLTLHTAKGLEFEAVFIVGMEEGICPHSRSLDDPDAMEEERRLGYVGMTRAKRNLYLVRTFRRTLYGDTKCASPRAFCAISRPT